MKYKVGDKVKIRTDLRTDTKYGTTQVVDEMCTLCGQVVTIKEIYAKDQSYFIEEDNGWFWTDEMFESLIKTTKQLGKIIFAEYGILKDYSKQIGLQLGFSIGCKMVEDGGKYTVFIDYENDENIDQKSIIADSVRNVHQILKDAKVNYVSELINKPVEVTMEDNTFKDFRILTEVL